MTIKITNCVSLLSDRTLVMSEVLCRLRDSFYSIRTPLLGKRPWGTPRNRIRNMRFPPEGGLPYETGWDARRVA